MRDNDDVVTTTTRRKAKRLHRVGGATVYRSKAARKAEPVWRDVVAGLIFFTGLITGAALLIIVALLIFG